MTTAGQSLGSSSESMHWTGLNLRVATREERRFDTALKERWSIVARSIDRQMWGFATRHEADGTVASQLPGPPPENGEFWSDVLDRIKDEAHSRYAVARRHLPLRGAKWLSHS